MWGKIGYSIYIICIHIYILWKLHRTSVLIKQIQFQCYVMLSVSILSIFTLEYLPFDYMQTLEEKKKKRISRARCWLDIQWGGEGKQLVGKRSAAKKRCYYYSWNMHETMGDDKVELICCNFSAFSPVNLLFLVGSSPLN